MEEKRPLDPTRRLLRVFGVKVTDYEDRTKAILEQARAADPAQPAELLPLAAELAELTADLNARLRDITTHVLEAEAKVLQELQATLSRQ
jgi:hypothetical protein